MFIYKVHFAMNFTKLLIVIAALVVTITMATFFFKVSVHSLSWSGVVGIILPFNRTEVRMIWPTAVLILIAGLVMSARLKLNAHSTGEVMIGAVIGFIVGFAGIAILFH